MNVDTQWKHKKMFIVFRPSNITVLHWILQAIFIVTEKPIIRLYNTNPFSLRKLKHDSKSIV